jgi:transposase-like protein
MAIVQRDGPVTAFRVNDVKANTVNAALRTRVYPDATVMTDQFASYKFLYQYFKGGHETVNHSVGQYVDGNAHTNTVESFFALLKRGVHGTFHHVSKKHLTRYAGEFAFRWTNRKVRDGARAEAALDGVTGVHLPYKTLIKN